ncbi:MULTISPECIES: alkaline phosphatase D family protein [unclassified Saccharicrinis]|uniref:alkaline phosphatase D family protein n=1 Tax=unclassified Saccharicrinis TaxID=2646859 RepID=UPI003D34D216
MTIHKNIIVCLAIFGLQICYSQSPLQSGPMLGYTDMKETAIWIQTRQEAEVSIRYWIKGNKGEFYTTSKVQTLQNTACTATLIANKVEPGNVYQYQVVVDGTEVDIKYPTEFRTQPIWKWRTEPPNFTFATGSCAYVNEESHDRPGAPYGEGYEIFEAIYKSKPDLMVWLGDNTYLREPDWHTWTGILHRWTHTRSLPELQPMLASVHHYAIWDDHDYGPDNSDRGWWNKNKTFEAFKLFWANPSYGVGDTKGVFTHFQWNDVDFFLLDNRFYRSPNNLIADNKSILGEEQKQWLKDALVYSEANFKVVAIGGQFLNTAAKFETYANYGFGKERQEIIDFIDKQKIKNVVFVTGDRHHSELSVFKEDNKPRIIDVTVSPFTSGLGKAKDEGNTLRVEGTYVEVRNYALISFSGTSKKRMMNIQIRDQKGKMIWEKKFEKE